MATQWLKFTASLEARGLSFEKVRLATDIYAIIKATGITDPLDIAVIETEWKSRLEGRGIGVTSPPERPASTPSVQSSTNQANAAYISLQKHGNSLLSAPDEVQDSIVAIEVLGVLIGRCGALFTRSSAPLYSSNGEEVGEKVWFQYTPALPQSMRSVIRKIFPVAEAYQVLLRISGIEVSGESSVAMALGEVISELCCVYVGEIGRLERWWIGRSMPLMRIVADAQRIGYPVVRLAGLITDMLVTRGAILNGAQLLNYLHSQLLQAAGCQEDQQLLALLLRRVTIPYLTILKLWMREGILCDPFGEFFVGENKQAEAEAIEDADKGRAFEVRFQFKKDAIPVFMNRDRMAKMACVAGQYCCLLRECAGRLPPIAATTEREPIVWTDAEDLQRAVQKYFQSACGAVIGLLFDTENDLLGRFASIKKFFLLGSCDWLGDFLDAAGDLLKKPLHAVNTHTVNVLLQTAIAKSSVSSDKYQTCIGCSFSNYTLEQYVESIITEAEDTPPDSGTLRKMRCVDLLQLNISCRWPATLIITPLVVKQLNLIFRLLLWLSVSERDLHEAWPVKQQRLPPLAVSLKQMMLQFVRQFQFYASQFVLERCWGNLMHAISQADSVFAISQAIEAFCTAVDVELVLASPHRFHRLANLLNLVLQFCDLGRQSKMYNATKMNEKIKPLRRAFLLGLSDLANPRGPDYQNLLPLLTWLDFSRFYEIRNVFKVQHRPGAQIAAEATGLAGATRISATAQSDNKHTPLPQDNYTNKNQEENEPNNS